LAELSLRGIVKRYGAAQVIHGVDLDIRHGEFVVFVGPSGCGKSTLLRMIAGLEEISAGELCIDGARVNEVAPAKRKIAMVFQSYALYPHMSVYDNLAFGLRTAGEKKDVIDQRVRQVAKMLQIETFLQRKPKALSGGQRQRVAIGRAIVREPRLFLFDEPLSNLDAELRVQMRVELSRLHAELGSTMIYVTHDQVEAMTMADRIVVLKDGRIAQAGTPLELYNTPANRFVAGFIGSPKMNFLDGVAAGRAASGIDVLLHGGDVVNLSRLAPQSPEGSAVCVGIRPEHVELVDSGLPLEVALTEQLGGNTVLYGTLHAQQALVVQVVGQSRIKRGDTVHVRLPPEHCHGFAPDGQSIAASAHVAS
jgi:multiple sugar transport system ATP-binding protein